MSKPLLLPVLLLAVGLLSGQGFSQTTVVVGIETNALTRKNLAELGTPADGTIYHCNDCAEGSDPCTGSGTGATAKRDNGRWVCYDGGGAGGAPTNATYITQTPNATLTNEQALSALSNGLLKHTAGVVAQAIAETDYVAPTGAGSLSDKTIDAGTATTTHAAGANFILTLRHATDCTSITDGISGEICYEQDANALFVCEPTAGGCDTAGEWISIEAATAVALSANGSNCSAGQFPKGVDASGAAESCAALLDSDVPNTLTLTSNTIDSGIATTVHAAGANFLQTLRHATDCTAITDGKDGELCWEKDANSLYVCEPTAGDCNTAGEWIIVTGAGSGDSVSVNGSAATDADFDDATPAAPTDAVNARFQITGASPSDISSNIAFKSPLSKTGEAIDFALAVDNPSATQVRLGSNCSATNPCNARIGHDIATLQNSCTATITGGTESGAWGWEVSAQNGNFVFFHNISDANVTVAGTSCVEALSQSAFNADNFPLASDTITTGNFDFSALSDKRGMGRDVVIPGTAITITAGADGRRTAALDVTSSPAITGDWNFGGGGIEIENGTTPPACTEGQLFFDTDATSGQRLLGCEGTTFVAQGGTVYDLVDATNNGYFNPHWQVVDAANANVTNTVGGANNVYLISFSVPGGNRVVTTDVTFQIQVADAAATMEIGIYNAACSSILAQTGAMTTGVTDSTGFKNVAWSGGAKTLNAGRYWLAVTNNSATLAWRSWQTNDFLNGLLNQTGATRMSTGAATTGGVLSSTCGTQTADGNVDPIALVLE